MDIRIAQSFENAREGFEVGSPFEYYLKTRHFVGGYVDMIATKIKHKIPKSKDIKTGEFSVTYPRTLTDDERKAKDLENIERAARRAKQAVQHAIRQISADHMLTLTTRENITDRSQFFEIFTRFIRLVREKDLINGQLTTRKEKRFYPFVAVPEYQERGAFHMHIACVGKQDIPLLRACWYTALGGNIGDTGSSTLGQIDVRFNPKRFSAETEVFKTMKLVDYLTKYIAKSFEVSEQLGVTRYTKSRQIPKPIVHKQFLLACFANGQKGFLDAIKEVIGISEFIGIGNDYQLWNRGEDIFILRGKFYD